ncbi:MAG: hypothetical protein R3Y11_09295 [Pseudomonadota bacterium]
MEGEKSTAKFHSFRHTFITEAYNLPQYNEQAIKELVSHEDDKKNITATVYKNAYSMASLYDEIVSRLDLDKRLGLHVLKDHAQGPCATMDEDCVGCGGRVVTRLNLSEASK